MLKEFKEFAMKGNLIDMAVGVVMGGAFGKVTTAFIEGMVMPLIGMISGGVDLSKSALTLVAETKDAAGKVVPAVDVKWGAFVTDVINFLVVAGVVFMVIKSINAAKKAAPPPPPPAPPVADTLLGEIRDLLKSGR